MHIGSIRIQCLCLDRKQWSTTTFYLCFRDLENNDLSLMSFPKIFFTSMELMTWYTLWCLRREMCLSFHTWLSLGPLHCQKRSHNSLLDQAFLQVFSHWHIPSVDTRTNHETHVSAMDMLSSISQAGGDKSMKPMALCLFFI